MNGEQEVIFLARHGHGHTVPPHLINYRANIWALRDAGVKDIISVAAVGGITAEMGPERLVFPDQISDYTWGREHTYFTGGDNSSVEHIDFSSPYCAKLRDNLIATANDLNLKSVEFGCYAATQGPRLESVAEINRLERDGCDIVGMTGMPEASLAREAELCYATVAVVANWAAGKGDETEITMEQIDQHVAVGMQQVSSLIAEYL